MTTRRPVGRFRPGVVVFGLLVSIAAAGCQAPRAGRVLHEVEGKAQRHSLSCESRSACDLLGWYGIAVDEDAFFARLPRSSNPEEGFVGSVDDPGGGLPPRGYGVYERPIADTLGHFGLRCRAVRGVDLAWLRERLDAGDPVIVWVVSGCVVRPTVTLRDARGRTFVAVPGEHSVLAVGYQGRQVILLDPATGRRTEVPAERFDASWAVLGRRAVVAERAP